MTIRNRLDRLEKATGGPGRGFCACEGPPWWALDVGEEPPEQCPTCGLPWRHGKKTYIGIDPGVDWPEQEVTG